LKYAEIEPSPALARVVKVFWSLRGTAPSHDEGPVAADRILPDGCPEIVVNRADRFRRLLDDGSSHRQAEILLVGPLRRAIRIAPDGVVDLLGIRLRPGGLFALLGVPAHELVDVDVSLMEFAVPLVAELRAASARGSFAARVEGVERALLRQLEKRGRVARGGALTGHATRLAAGGRSTVEQLARTLNVNRRALERLFRVEVGLSPKLFLRIQRLQAVVGALEAGPPTAGWAQLACEHGYVDQPHLIRDFRLLAGATPRSYLAERTDLGAAFELDLSRSSNH
jgi:AraC-like DNA-binding protein